MGSGQGSVRTYLYIRLRDELGASTCMYLSALHTVGTGIERRRSFEATLAPTVGWRILCRDERFYIDSFNSSVVSLVI